MFPWSSNSDEDIEREVSANMDQILNSNYIEQIRMSSQRILVCEFEFFFFSLFSLSDFIRNCWMMIPSLCLHWLLENIVRHSKRKDAMRNCCRSFMIHFAFWCLCLKFRMQRTWLALISRLFCLYDELDGWFDLF